VQNDQAAVKPQGAQPDDQRQDKKKAELKATKEINRIEIRRLVMGTIGNRFESVPENSPGNANVPGQVLCIEFGSNCQSRWHITSLGQPAKDTRSGRKSLAAETPPRRYTATNRSPQSLCGGHQSESDAPGAGNCGVQRIRRRANAGTRNSGSHLRTILRTKM
jgi:hypothetical protein